MKIKEEKEGYLKKEFCKQVKKVGYCKRSSVNISNADIENGLWLNEDLKGCIGHASKCTVYGEGFCESELKSSDVLIVAATGVSARRSKVIAKDKFTVTQNSIGTARHLNTLRWNRWRHLSPLVLPDYIKEVSDDIVEHKC